MFLNARETVEKERFNGGEFDALQTYYIRSGLYFFSHVGITM